MGTQLRWLSGIALMAALLASSYLVAAQPAASVDIAPWYPQGKDYVFICSLDDFTATSYDWDFGDGQKLYDVTNGDVFHRYASNGTYEVTCAGQGSEGNIIGHRSVTVGQSTPVQPPPPSNETGASATLRIAPWFPQGRDYVFVCDAEGFTASSYDWDFGDGQKLYDMSADNVFHRFASGGSFTVNCEASAPGKHADAWMQVTAQ